MVLSALCLCPSCGSCHRQGDKAAEGGGTASDSAALQSPEAILNGPQALDPQGLRSYAAAVNAGNAEFTPSDLATMVFLGEGAVERLDSEVENLVRNEDAADSYNVLTELDRSRWPADACTLIAFLRTVPLNGALRPRADQLVRAAARVQSRLAEIARTQHGGKTYLTLDIEPRRTQTANQ